MRLPLTRRQKDVLDFIVAYTKEHPMMAPTLSEIADGTGMGTVSSVQGVVTALRRKGYLSQPTGKGRASRSLVPVSDADAALDSLRDQIVFTVADTIRSWDAAAEEGWKEEFKAQMERLKGAYFIFKEAEYRLTQGQMQFRVQQELVSTENAP